MQSDLPVYVGLYLLPLRHPVPVARQPDASLLLPCQDPALVDDPDTATDNEVAAERIRVAEAYLACKRRHADLVTFVTAR